MAEQETTTPAEVAKRIRAVPKSLAEKMAAKGSECPIPFTHDRLAEVHHWWHELARNYHEPVPFRYVLGAFIQAARNVRFMLQNEKAKFSDFGFYAEWVAKVKTDPVMQWLNDERVGVVHQRALEPKSWLEMRCIDNPRMVAVDEEDEDDVSHPFRFHANPFMCTHYYMENKQREDHGHQFERHWESEGLPGRELLSGCADVYDRLDDLVTQAHEVLGHKVVKYAGGDASRQLPCMENTLSYRAVRTVIRDGREIWQDEPADLHHP